ncbi:hypothetical protein [Oceanobacillus bengalensis]|uniref:hypothetical protein n=1 Tax=Oceanobacillus bengalensis TaxID=1435466 RepID=UPI0015FFB771|nr:hypothetical protein [Oceanobacillus bengalensis]
MNDALLGILFLACLVLGMVCGMVFQSIEIGGAVGLGVGLIILILFRRKDNRRL